MDSDRLSVLIVEDHALFGESLKLGLESDPQFNVLGLLRNGLDAVNFCKQSRQDTPRPDIILMDICMPEMNGIEATQQIKRVTPDVKIIVITSLKDRKAVATALAVGADAYCTKETSLERLRQIINLVRDGVPWVDPQLAHFILQEFVGSTLSQPPVQATPSLSKLADKPVAPQSSNKPLPSPPRQVQPRTALPAHRPMDPDTALLAPAFENMTKDRVHASVLTAREIEILKLIAENRSNQEISDLLGMNIEWVSGYIRTVLRKLAVDNEVQAVQKGLNDGILLNAPLLESEQLA